MSTLAEIEAAVDQLPPPEQETLLARLARKLAARPPAGAAPQTQREHWLQKLDRLRAHGSAGGPAIPLQDLFDDLRTERGA